MKTLSICIPTYEMKGLGEAFLRQSFDTLAMQTCKDFDIVVSDHSQNDHIEILCKEYSDKLDIHYYRNEEKKGSSSANINNAIKNATGKLIKILFQDDFLYHERALEEIVSHFDENDHWLATGCIHTIDGETFFKPQHPRYTRHIYFRNTMTSPSVITIKNDAPLLFDEDLFWMMDIEYYKRCYDRYGKPKIIDDINVVSRIGAHQVTHSMATAHIRRKEYLTVVSKYEHGFRLWLYSAADYLRGQAKQVLGLVWKKYAVTKQ